MKNLTVLLLLPALLAASLVAATSSPSQAGTAEADAVAATVAAAAPDIPGGDAPAPLTFDEVGSQLEAESSDLVVTAPSSSSGSVTLESNGSPDLVVGLPDVSVTAPELSSASTTAVYLDAGESTDVSVQPSAEGVQVSTVLNDSSAPTRFSYAVHVPPGGRTVLTGAVAVVVDANDEAVGFIGNPWATDADGKSVDTHFELDGTDLVQVVNHRESGVSYPVVADPYMGRDMIKSAKRVWIKRDGSIGAGWTWQVTPTRWARAFGGAYVAGAYGWKELRKKYKNRGLTHNLGGMKDQFICHQQVVALYAPRKPTWNLDEWRKNVSYKDTVRASCNPPRGGKYAY